MFHDKKNLLKIIRNWTKKGGVVYGPLRPPLNSPLEGWQTPKQKEADYGTEHFYSRGQHQCKFIGTKKNGYIRTCLEYLHGRRFVVLEHQYGRRDVL